MARQFAPIPTDRLHERVANQLRDAILDGTYQPGDRLPGERELIDLFKVSRSAVRQALLLLQQQGLIIVRQGSGGGAFVSGQRLDPLLQAFENLFALQGVTAEQFVAAKAVLEPVITATAADHVDADDLAALRQNLDECESALAEGRPIAQLLLDFHLAVAAATHNPILDLVLVALVRIAERLPTAPKDQAGDWEAMLESHRAIYTALSRRSAKAVHREMSHHLREVWGDVAEPSRKR
ncbi:FadR/GntR family transcriptional regulator [Streptomyces spiralis]|uniref:FadR/GntR family transcriptional regulator n=1 Tax=Streptomyces spiralis TaxID=66376 RepID=UPI00368750B1